MSEWGFLTNHARALLHIAKHPDVRLRDLALALEVTERTAFGLVADLTGAGYVLKERDGRRNRYHVQPQLPVRDTIIQGRTIGDVLELVTDIKTRPRNRRATD